SGEFAGHVGLCLDVTDRREAAETVRQSDAFRRSVFENSPDCLKIIDLDGRILEMNEAGCRLMELDHPDEVRDTHWADLWPRPSGSARSPRRSRSWSGPPTPRAWCGS